MHPATEMFTNELGESKNDLLGRDIVQLHILSRIVLTIRYDVSDMVTDVQTNILS